MRSIFYNFRENVDLDLPSRRQLFKQLGDHDTLAEYTFCAVRDFEANWDKSTSFDDYVTEKAIQYNVNLRGGVHLENHEPALIKSFLMNSHAMLEDFVDQYKHDIRNLIAPEFSLDSSDKISKSERLLKSLDKMGVKPNFPVWFPVVMKYYRLVRNSTAHNEKDEKASVDAYNDIDLESIYKEYYIFEEKAPNSPDNLTFDDFYFYSACIKHFANYLTMALKGRVDWHNLGSIHENFDVSKFKKGTQPLPLIDTTLSMYNHRTTKEERIAILANIKQQKENLFKDK